MKYYAPGTSCSGKSRQFAESTLGQDWGARAAKGKGGKDQAECELIWPKALTRVLCRCDRRVDRDILRPVLVE